MAKVDSNVEVTIKRARLSFEHIFKAQTPRPDKDGKVGAPTFNCAFLVSKKDDKMLDEIEDAIQECKEKMWGKNPPKIRSDRTPYRDGSEYEYEGYDGCMVISARNQRAPQVVHSKKDEDGKFVKLDGSEGVIYSGCYVNGIVRFWAQDSQDYGKRVNCSLEVVQFFSDGDAFSGASKVDADDRLAGLEGEVKDEDPRTEGRRRERDSREEPEQRRRRDRDADTDRHEKGDDNGRGRSGERGASRRGEDEERPSRDRDGGRDRDGRDSGRGRDRDEDDRSSRSRSSRDDGDSGDRRSARSSDRDGDVDRGSSRRSSERSERDRGDDRDRGRDRERSSSRDEDRGSSRSRSSRGAHDDLI